MKRVSISIKGKVQGVWFRKSTQLKAQELGLVGFVRNEDDGSVYAEAEGPDEQVKQLFLWCHQGSPMSKVDHVFHQEIPIKQETSFEIHR